MNVRRWLTSLYPRGWRERYGDEFEVLLEQCLQSPLDVLDIFLGALDAHLALEQPGGWKGMNRMNKLRTSILLVFAAYIAFVVGGASLYGLVDDSPMAVLMHTHMPLLAAWLTVEAGSVIALLAVVIGGLPLAWTILSGALRGEQAGAHYLLVPVLAFAALVLYAAFLALIAFQVLRIPGILPSVTAENFPPGNRLLIGGGWLLFVLGALASTAAVWKAVTSSDRQEGSIQILGRSTSVRLYEFAFPAAVVTALAMCLMWLATLLWGWLAYTSLPDVFRSGAAGPLSSTGLSLLGIVVIMTLATGVAIGGLARGYRTRAAA